MLILMQILYFHVMIAVILIKGNNMSLFTEGWPNEEIFDKYEQGEELTGQEALAFLCASFSNATKNNYDAEALFNRINSNFSLKLKKESDKHDDYYNFH